MSGVAKMPAILLSPVLPAPGGSGRALRAWDWLLELAAAHDEVLVWIPGSADAVAPPLPPKVTLCYGGEEVRPTSAAWRRLAWLLPPLVLAGRGAAVADWLWPRPGGDPFAALLAALKGRRVARLVVFRLYLHPLSRVLRERLQPGSWELDMDDHESATRRSVAGAQWRLGRPLEALLRAAEAEQYRLLEGRVAAAYDRVWLAAAEDLAPLRAALAAGAGRRRSQAVACTLALTRVEQRRNRLPPRLVPAGAAELCQPATRMPAGKPGRTDRSPAIEGSARGDKVDESRVDESRVDESRVDEVETGEIRASEDRADEPRAEEGRAGGHSREQGGWEAGAALSPQPRLELLFVGGLDYPPNEEGLRFLLRAVLPGLAGQLAQPWRLSVVGRRPSQSLQRELARQPGVELLSEVEDLGACYARTDLVLVPLFAGGGSKLKTLEAFAWGCAVVASAEGVRGLSAAAGRDYRHADSAPDFIAAIAELAHDAAARRALAQAGQAFYRRYCDA